ncbi:hypothetical protein [Rossellomorea marisflavi]|uniref:hypothetical protein n=1 Tax=Rossellomorea marisflavi TaxID=189381 RepID=UPI0034591F8D
MKRGVVFLCIGFIMFFISACGSEGEFAVENLSTSPLRAGESYYIALPLSWTGSEKAIMKSVELLEDGSPITSESGITYAFYAGGKEKKTGVCQREEIGSVEKVEGVEIGDEGTLVMETIMTDVKPNEKRKLRFHYTVIGQEREQIVSSGTVENLETSTR